MNPREGELGRERFQDLHHGHFVTIRKHQKEEPGHVHFSFVERDRDGEYWSCDYTSGSDYSDTGTVGRANYLALKEMCEELESEHGRFWVDAYGAHASFGILLDVETTPDEIVEVLEGLEDYPLISDEALSDYEMQLADEAWENWGKGEFRKELEKKFGGDAAGVTDEDLFQCFHDAMEETNTYWEAEGSDMYVDMKQVVKGVDSPPEGFEEE